MAEIQITIKNLPQIKRAFGMSPLTMRKNLAKAMNKTVLTVGSKATVNAPVDTGRLRSSILGGSYKAGHGRAGGSFTTNYGVGLASSNVLTASVGSNVEYALFVHEGTRYMRARPFLRKAVESSQAEVDGYFLTSVQQTLDEIARQT